MEFTQEQEQVIKSTLWALSILKHCRVDEHEKKGFQEIMEINIKKMDDTGIPWRVQNSIFYIAEKMDVRSFYLSTMLKAAMERATA